MHSSWLTRICLIVVVSCFKIRAEYAAGTDPLLEVYRRAICDAVSARMKGEQSLSADLNRGEGGKLVLGPTAKRKWGDTTMTSWGKRASNQADDELLAAVCGVLFSRNRRPWGENSVSAWGKRDDLALEEENEKRRWGENTMQTWGKRLAVTDDDRTKVDRRKWGENKVSAWGKRAEAEKRKWGENNMKVWGKRHRLSAAEENGEVDRRGTEFLEVDDQLAKKRVERAATSDGTQHRSMLGSVHRGPSGSHQLNSKMKIWEKTPGVSPMEIRPARQ